MIGAQSNAYVQNTVDTLVVPLTNNEFDQVPAHFSTKKFRKHQFLVQQRDTVKFHYFIGLYKEPAYDPGSL
jgi:hypothetical protein